MQQGVNEAQEITNNFKLHLKYEGTDSSLIVDFNSIELMKQQFNQSHQQRYGFIVPEKNLIVETASLELICPTYKPENNVVEQTATAYPEVSPIETVAMYVNHTWQDTPVYQREQLPPGTIINSPAIIIEATGTNIIEPGWQGIISDRGDLILSRAY